MPHQRKRQLLQLFKKRLQLHPCLGLIGARQTGKSTFLKKIISEVKPTEYLSMDSKNLRMRAEKSPEAFSEPIPNKTLIIDEVQKVPDLFDSVKLHIDENRQPGMYILSGSTEFSSFTGVRESLTGRIGISYLYPFILSEIYEKNFGSYYSKFTQSKALINIKEFDKKISNGGMPGFFYLHSKEEWNQANQNWIETTCYRDVSKLLKKSFDPELAFNIFAEICRAEDPTATEVASTLKVDTRVVSRYLDAFVKILVLIKVSPHKISTGKDQFYSIDSGFCNYFGSSRDKMLKTHVLIEALSHYEYNEMNRPQVYFYQSQKKSKVPFVFYWPQTQKHVAIQISDSESPSRAEIAAILSFQKKLENKKNRYIILNQSSTSYKENGLEYHPLRG